MVNKKHSKATVSEVYRSKYALVLVLIIIDFMMIMMVENQWVGARYVISVLITAGLIGSIGVGYDIYRFCLFNQKHTEQKKVLYHKIHFPA